MQSLIAAVALVVMAAAAGPGTPPAPALKLDNVRLLVSRFDETFAFYRDVLGLQVTWGKPGENYASFAFPGGGQIALFRGDLMAAAVAGATPPLAQTRHDAVALILASDDVDAACRALAAKGVAFLAPPADQPAWGIRVAHFRDPEGNLIEVFSPLRRQ